MENIGRLGKISEYMMECIRDRLDTPAGAVEIYSEPNKTYYKTYTEKEYEGYESISFTFLDGTWNTMKLTLGHKEYKYEEEIRTGSQLIHPDHPEWGYKAELVSSKKTELPSGVENTGYRILQTDLCGIIRSSAIIPQ